MGLKLRIALLTCLVLAAAVTSVEAYKSIVPSAAVIPEEVYARFEGGEANAKYFLRSCDGYVAVYADRREKQPMTVTDIEVSSLRRTDRALIQKGIPVADTTELLYLLEDLGS